MGRLGCTGLVLAILVSTIDVAAASPKDQIQEVWAQYRKVGGEREEAEILVVDHPSPAAYTASTVRSMLPTGADGVVHKRAVLHIVYAADHRDQLHILFSLPPEDAGLGFLVRRAGDSGEDGMWLFMPGYRSVRRLPADARQRLAGTDLLYEDVRDLAGERTARYVYEATGAEQLDGRNCDVIVATPKKGTSSAYSKRRIWIDRERRFPLKVEFFDDDEELWKVLHNSDVREAATGVWRADLLEMRDLKAQQATLVLVVKREVGLSIPARVFSQDNLVHPGND